MHQQSAHCESLRKTMIFALANPWRILAKACETIDCESLRILAKRCETIFANSRESLRKPAKSYLRNLSISAKAYLRKLAKIHPFCTCESYRKHDLQNHAKSVFIDSPTPPPGLPQNPLVILNVFTLLVITILQSMVSACFLSFVCPKCVNIQVCQPTYEETQLHS